MCLHLTFQKISTYLKRKKIRDLYDIFFLLRHVKVNSKMKEKLRILTKRFEFPEDEQNLKAILISGPIPTTKNMLDYIERWAR